MTDVLDPDSKKQIFKDINNDNISCNLPGDYIYIMGDQNE